MNAPDDLEAELARRSEQALADRLRDIPVRALSMLALLPEWTTSLAERVGLGDVGELVDRLEDIGLVERRQILGAGGTRAEAFWVRASRRPDLARHLREVRGDELEHDLEELAGHVYAADAGLVPWYAAVTRHRADPSGLSMIHAVDTMIADDRLGEASRLIAAAQIVGEVIGGPLTDSARRAQWRIDWANRTAEDLHHLWHYQRRANVEEALNELVYGPDETWMLHLLGNAGAGKTMVIRYLASGRFAADHRSVWGHPRFPVARADFDHLDPRYPEQRPAEVLLALAGELLAFSGTRASERSYRRFQDATDELHEELARTDRDPERGDRLLRAAVAALATFTQELPGPVVLVLDTCEELAKLYTPGSSAPAIDRTFHVLELLHEMTPSIRVVLAGRRWLVQPPEDLQRASGPVLRPRPYVRVLTVGGFTEIEARQYLDGRARAYREQDPEATDPLPPVVAAALLERARQQDGYNPFDLACYCEWALSEPDRDPQEFADELRHAPGDPYVEQRIIGRLADDDVRGALGVAAQLGRFDLDLARRAFTRAGADPQAAFHWLAAQEWVNVVALGTDGRPRVIEVDEHLRDRIRAVTAAAPDRYPVDLGMLGRDAAELIDRTRLTDLPAETVEAAVRLLPVEEAGKMWQELEDRIAANNQWAWGAQVAARAGAIELARAEGDGPTMLAAIIASQTGARIHTGQRHDLTELWAAVRRYSSRHPDPAEADRLKHRADLGSLAAAPLDDPDSLEAWRVAHTEEMGGSIAAALERIPPVLSSSHPALSIDGPAAFFRGARAIIVLYRSMLELADGAFDSAADWVDEWADAAPEAFMNWTGLGDFDDGIAEVLALDARGASVHGYWADWVQPYPVSLRDRCRFARLFVAFVRGEGLDSLPWRSWRGEALERLDDIDAERLVALTVRFELGHRPVPREVLSLIEERERYAPARRPYAWLHDQVRPLVVELAEAWRVLGEPGRAQYLLERRINEAVAAGEDPDTIEECQLALLRLCRGYRTLDYFSGIERICRNGSPRERAAAWLVRTLVNGDMPESPREAGSWHGWWQCQFLYSLHEQPPRWAPPGFEPGIPAVDTRADVREFAELYRDFPASRLPAFTGDNTPSFDPEHALRGDEEMPVCAVGELGRALLAVGEVRALRFPDKAAHLLYDAVDLLAGAGDRVAASQAAMLAVLAEWRVSGRGSGPLARSLRHRLLEEARPFLAEVAASGWPERARVVLDVLERDRTSHVHDSPELGLSTGFIGAGDPELLVETALLPLPPPRIEEPSGGSIPSGPVPRGSTGAPPPGSGLGRGGLGGGGLGTGGIGGPPGGSTRSGIGATGRGAGGVSGTPMGGAGRREDREEDRESERSTWLTEDDDVWGTDNDAALPPQSQPPSYGPLLPSPQPEPLRRSSARKFVWLLFAFLLIPVAAATTYLVYSLSAAGASNPQPTGSPPSPQPNPPGGGSVGSVIIPVLVGIGIGFAVVGAVIVVVRLATLRLGLTLTVRISRPNEGAEKVRLATERVHRSAAEFDGGWRARVARITPMPLGTRGRRSWTVATGLQAPNIDVVGLRLPKSRLRQPVIRLDISERLAHLPWERLLAASAPGSPDRALLCFREDPNGLPLGWRSGAKQWRNQSNFGYLGPSHLARPLDYSSYLREFDLSSARGTRVLHLVGTPVSTKGGWRIRVPSPTLGTEGRGSRADETLLGPGELAVLGLQASKRIQVFLVVQAEPVDGPPETLGELRDGFISFAQQLGLGSPILVIPPLPDDVARAAIELIRNDIGSRKRPPRPTTLLRLLARLKAMVADAEEAARSEQHAAGDVLLFMATHV